MKRDMDLVRKILLAIEADPNPRGMLLAELEKAGDRSEQEMAYHVLIMEQGGLITTVEYTDRLDGLIRNLVRLTWAGHDFVELIRDDDRWEDAKRAVMAATGGLGYDRVRIYLIESAMRKIGKPGAL